MDIMNPKRIILYMQADQEAVDLLIFKLHDLRFVRASTNLDHQTVC